MSLEDVFKDIKKKFSPRKTIDFKEENMHFELEPVNSLEESVITESLQDIEGSQYIQLLRRYTLSCAIKKINGVEIEDEVKYMDEEGREKVKSHFLFMRDYISQWPQALINIIFDAYTNMLRDVEKKMRDNAVFERIALSDEIEEEISEKFHKINEETTQGLNETERLNRKVQEEIDRENLKMAEELNKKTQEEFNK